MGIKMMALLMFVGDWRSSSANACSYEDKTACGFGDDVYCNGGLCSHWCLLDGRKQIKCINCPGGREGRCCERYIWESPDPTDLCWRISRDPCWYQPLFNQYIFSTSTHQFSLTGE